MGNTDCHPERIYDEAENCTNETGRFQLRHALDTKGGKHLTSNTHVIDIGGGEGFHNIMENVSPCLTCARAVSGGFWVSTYGRRFQVPEMCILQGMPADRLTYKGIIPESAFRKIIGNAFSLNVMERILVRALNATHLLPQKLLDRWEGNMKAMLKAFALKYKNGAPKIPKAKIRTAKGPRQKAKVYCGNYKQTANGLRKGDLVRSKSKQIVSKKAQAHGRCIFRKKKTSNLGLQPPKEQRLPSE